MFNRWTIDTDQSTEVAVHNDRCMTVAFNTAFNPLLFLMLHSRGPFIPANDANRDRKRQDI